MHYPKTLGGRNNAKSIRIKEPYNYLFPSDGRQILERYPVSFYVKYDNDESDLFLNI